MYSLLCNFVNVLRLLFPNSRTYQDIIGKILKFLVFRGQKKHFPGLSRNFQSPWSPCSKNQKMDYLNYSTTGQLARFIHHHSHLKYFVNWSVSDPLIAAGQLFVLFYKVCFMYGIW